MDTLLTLLNVVVLVLLIGLLVIMHRKHISFSKRVFAGLGLGIAYGLILHFAYGVDAQVLVDSVGWFSIIGSGYVKLLQMVAMPLVFISILSAFTKVIIGKNFGKMAALILFILVGTTAIAAAVGITSAVGFQLDASQIVQGDAEMQRGEDIAAKSADISEKHYHNKLSIYCLLIHF